MRQHGRLGPAKDQAPARNVTKQQLSQPRKELIELGQVINHGWIENLEIRDREPVMFPLPTFYCDFKFEAENGPRHELVLDDFVLKAKQLDLFAFFDRIENGIIKRLEFKGGLPFRMVVKGGWPPRR
jgi:hypothetical protein